MPIEVNRPMRAAWWAELFEVKLPVVPPAIPACFKPKDGASIYDVWHALEDGIESTPSASVRETRLRTMHALEALMDVDTRRN